MDYHSRIERFFKALEAGQLGNYEFVSMRSGQNDRPFQMNVEERKMRNQRVAYLFECGRIEFGNTIIPALAPTPVRSA